MKQPTMNQPATNQPATTDRPRSNRLAINAAWYGKLRWVAALGQLVTIAVVAWPLGISVPRGPLLALVAVTVASNAVFWWWSKGLRGATPPSRAEWQAVLGGLMLLDLVMLTAILYLTGGTTNPFVLFYFVNLALSGVLLPAWWAWVLSMLAVIAFGYLSCSHEAVPVLQDPARLRSLKELAAAGVGAPIAMWGAWVAFAGCAAVIVAFTTRLTAELRSSERRRRRAEEERARAAKLEALGTLAAGAAHELATPLSTIAVATGEALRQLEGAGASLEALDDLRLVRSELTRCRTILDRMSVRSGQAPGERPETIRAAALVEEVLGELAARDRVRVEYESGAGRLEVLIPRVALSQALRGVVQNAIDATAESASTVPVEVRADPLASTLRLRVIDNGPGMPPAVLARASEPFYTTKPPGRGMGLGLYLARSVVERLGGSLRIESIPGSGTTVTIVLPLA
ncbi:MAG: ATP-binding protein [Lacipirellulaceae bacterium]